MRNSVSRSTSSSPLLTPCAVLSISTSFFFIFVSRQSWYSFLKPEGNHFPVLLSAKHGSWGATWPWASQKRRTDLSWHTVQQHNRLTHILSRSQLDLQGNYRIYGQNKGHSVCLGSSRSWFDWYVYRSHTSSWQSIPDNPQTLSRRPGETSLR